tara:strand:+ start:581 stop:913 length:333 start_codon:yes stop_codon:yes gene_type:complete
MIRENLIKWGANLVVANTVEVPMVDGNYEQKILRQKVDFTKYGADDSYEIEFDDTLDTFTKALKGNSQIVDLFKALKLKIYKNGAELHIGTLPFKFANEIERAIANFMTS